jgi:phosphopentomutase
MIITADHGNDPTFEGTDHTRERVPLLVIGGEEQRDLGVRQGFSDVGASVAAWLGVESGGLPGEVF